jgi:hypothetical protein
MGKFLRALLAAIKVIFGAIWRTVGNTANIIQLKEISPARRYRVYDDISAGSEPRN